MCTYNSCPPPNTDTDCERWANARIAHLLRENTPRWRVGARRALKRAQDLIEERTGDAHSNVSPDVVLGGVA